MIKTGKLSAFLIVCTLFLTIPFSVKSQEYSVQVTLSESNIFEGERVQLNVQINGASLGSVQRPTLPDIEGIRALNNFVSQSQNFSNVNGRSTITSTFSYTFIADEEGSYSVPPISVTIAGERFESPPVPFKVLSPATVNTEEQNQAPEIYVRLEPTSSSLVVGEQVIADIVLYFKDGIEVSSYQAAPGWKAEGFWKEELQSEQRARATSVILNGVRYQKAGLLQYALFPTKAGVLTLSPFEVILTIRKQRTRDVFGFGMNQERLQLSSLPVDINVNRLPGNQNSQFLGAVGDFNVKRAVKPTSAMVGESIEVITEITGFGNVPLINKPEYEFPETIELYNPQQSTDITRANRRIGGSKIFTDILIARKDGNVEIPSLTVTTFNPSTNNYKRTTLPALEIDIRKDPRATNSVLAETRLDIKPITGLASWTTTDSTRLYNKWWVWFMPLLSFIVVGLAFYYKVYQNKLKTDVGFARAKKAKSLALETLDQAASSTDVKSGYHLIRKSLSLFITNKLDLPQGGLSTSELINHLSTTSLDKNELKKLKNLLEQCDTIAYAPNITQKDLNKDLDTAKELILYLNKSL